MAQRIISLYLVATPKQYRISHIYPSNSKVTIYQIDRV